MNSKVSQFYYNFTREQRSGIFVLFGIIVVLQMIYFCVDFSSTPDDNPEKQKWLSLQSKVDQGKINNNRKSTVVYLFNPNFITDYKGYKLGMSVKEIDRLVAFRKQNKFVNSVQEFQAVTQISDSLLRAIAPLFKFPNWVNSKKNKRFDKTPYPIHNSTFTKADKIIIIDINQATKDDLIKVYGIGDAISDRILKQKDKLGAFVSMEQMSDVWGLSPEVVTNLNTHFKVLKLPNVEKVAINDASIKELAQFYYFRYALAKEIVTYRSMNGKIKNIEDLTKIKGFPVDKAKIIALYLDFN